jgi:aryl-alcohol dehydrogenase-like predicted oxidoreductase
VPYSPLGRGFLTGTAKRAEEYDENDFRREGDPRLQGANFDANMKAADAIRAFAAEKGSTPAQIALAWVLHQGTNVVPIPGTKRRKYLEENLGAAKVELSASDLSELDAAIPPGSIKGPRYTPAMMAAINR